MAKSTQYQIQLKEEVTAQLRNIEAKLATTNQKMGEMATAGAKAFDVVKVGAYGSTAIVTLGKIADFTGEAVKAYGDLEEKQLRLEAQLKVSGNQLGLTAGQVMSLASALEDATGIDDSNILDAMATLQTFQNVTGDVFEEAIKQSGDMAVVFGDIDTAAKQLGAALEDPANNLDKLKKASIYFTDAEKAQIEAMKNSGDVAGAQAAILEKVKAKYDGLAESINTGVNGSLRNFSNAWDDTMKGMGKSFTTFAQPAIDALTAGLNAMNGNVSSLQGVLKGSINKADLSLFGNDQLRELQGQIGTFNASSPGDGPTAKRVQALEKLVAQILANRAQFASGSRLAGSTVTIEKNNAVDYGPQANGSLPAEARNGLAMWEATAEARKRDGELAQYYADRDAANAAAQEAERLARVADAETWAKDMQDQADAAHEAEMARIEEEKQARQSLYDTIAIGLNEVAKIAGLLQNQEEASTQANLERMKKEAEDYVAAQDLKIEVAKRNGEDTTQMEVDKANEVYAKKKQIDEAERAAKRKSWEANKQASLTQIAMNGAEAFMKSMSLLPPFNFIQAGIVTAATAAQLAIVAAQSAPAFASGGVVPGSSFSGDRVLSRLNSGEMVLNGRQQANLLSIANGGSVGGRVIYIDKVYGSVDQEFLDNLERSQDLRTYRGLKQA